MTTPKPCIVCEVAAAIQRPGAQTPDIQGVILMGILTGRVLERQRIDMPLVTCALHAGAAKILRPMMEEATQGLVAALGLTLV